MILVTGATGFVGKAVVEYLKACNSEFRACSRKENHHLSSGIETYFIDEMTEVTDWQQALDSVDVVIHLAARVHVMNDTVLDPLTEFRKVNTLGTLNLARQANAAGVKRFIFVSTIKVNGEMTENGFPFTADENVTPSDPYSISKYEAEQGLMVLAQETELEVVIIRPPLVYGPGVKANFAGMMKWVSLGIPLPFGAIHNQRSLVALDNLVSLLIYCIDHPKAANEIFLVSDGEDVSTTQLINKVARALGKKLWLIPIPVHVMVVIAGLLGKKDVTDRLLNSLQVDSSKARDLLSWKPIVTMDEQLTKMMDTDQSEKTV